MRFGCHNTAYVLLQWRLPKTNELTQSEIRSVDSKIFGSSKVSRSGTREICGTRRPSLRDARFEFVLVVVRAIRKVGEPHWMVPIGNIFLQKGVSYAHFHSDGWADHVRAFSEHKVAYEIEQEPQYINSNEMRR